MWEPTGGLVQSGENSMDGAKRELKEEIGISVDDNDLILLKTNTEKGNHDVFECIKLINPKNSVEEINEIIGFEGKCTNEENKVYVWELTEDTNVEVQYSKSNEGKIEISFPSKLIANDKVDFSRFSEIKKALNTKESLTYDQFVELVGGVEGTLKSKNSSSLKYEWDNTEGGYLFATFSVQTGKCTFTTGRF